MRLGVLLPFVFSLACADEIDWPTASPESVGISASGLEELASGLSAHGTDAFVVMRGDRVVYEAYAEGHTPATLHGTASMAKALVGGLGVALAIGDERIALDDRASKYIAEWRDVPAKKAITIRQLGSHTSGLQDSEPRDRGDWREQFWQKAPPPNDPFTLSRDAAPVLFPPGSQFQYSNPGIAMLGYAVTAALQGAPQSDLRSLLSDRVMEPIGVDDSDWWVGYKKTFEVDGLPLVAPWGGGAISARAALRVGRLALHRGNWNGEQLIADSAMRLTTRDSGLPNGGGMGWWTNARGDVASLPRDAFWAEGIDHQILLVVPSLDLVVVRAGDTLATSDEPKAQRPALIEQLFDPLMATVSSSAPYPQSPVISAVEWAPVESIVRKGEGGDNWPVTWADDDDLYTAYGDGRGFLPYTEEKLSLGLVKVSGGPNDFRGVNIRSETGEQFGEGPEGLKSSGILMVDGTLYMLVRNAGNSQLARSQDHGKSWTWADWKFETSFGYATFLNFGKNYAGARDGYVYVFSHDTDSAYEPADQMVLARVPKGRIFEQAAYEFFSGLDSEGDGAPQWSPDISQRQPVFSHPGRSHRSGITYNAGLGRYLWCQILPESRHPRGPRFQGGLGIYDAPEPWGPWTTSFFAEEWDVGPGETCSFPTKWMSRDGRVVHLLFSGDDAFSVRKATLELRD